MNISNEEHFQEIKKNYEGKSIIEKSKGYRFKIMHVGLNTYSQNEKNIQFAVAILEPLEANQNFTYSEPPSIDFIRHHFEILD